MAVIRADWLGRLQAAVWSWRVGGWLLAFYLGLSLLFWHALVGRFGSTTIYGGSGDSGLFISWLQWAAYAVTHGLDPLRNDYVQAPFGVSAMWNTSILALGVPLTPVTVIFGASVSFNTILVLSPALTSWTASKWLRRHVSTGPAAAGALIYGFSPFMIAHLTGHLHLTFLALLPVIVMLVEDLILRADRPLWPTAPLLGLTLAVQYLIGSEVLLMLALTILPVLAVLALAFRDTAIARARRVLTAGGAAATIALLLLAVPLVDQFSGRYRIDTAVMNTTGFVGRIRYLVNATPALYFHGPPASVAGLGEAENGTYIGWPLLIVLTLTVLVLRRTPLVRLAAVVAVVAVVCELDLRIAGVSVSPLAFLQRRHLALTQDILPVRFGSIFYLAAALLMALGVHEALRRAPAARWVGVVGIALTAVTLVSLTPGPAPAAGAPPRPPAFFTDGALQRTIPAGAIVMIAPMSVFGDTRAQYWQVKSNMWFKQLGGYALNNQGTGAASFYPRQVTLNLLFGIDRIHHRPFAGTPTATQLSRARAELAHSGATFFLVALSPDGAQTRTELVARLLGRGPDLTNGGMQIWHLGFTGTSR